MKYFLYDDTSDTQSVKLAEFRLLSEAKKYGSAILWESRIMEVK